MVLFKLYTHTVYNDDFKKKHNKRLYFAEDLGHLEGSSGVHVGGNDGDSRVRLLWVAECESPLQIHLGQILPQVRSLNTNEDSASTRSLTEFIELFSCTFIICEPPNEWWNSSWCLVHVPRMGRSLPLVAPDRSLPECLSIYLPLTTNSLFLREIIFKKMCPPWLWPRTGSSSLKK